MSSCWTRMSAFVIALILSTFVFGCSNSSTPVVPQDETPMVTPRFENQPAGDVPGNNIIGMYGFEFDEGALEMRPVDVRELAAHYDVTAWVYPPGCGGVGCLTYSLVAWDPVARILELYATIENPTKLTAFDARLIFRHFIHRTLLNADSYTPNFDAAGSINPFIAFAKSDPNRKFPPSPGKITEVVKIHWPAGAGGFMLNIVEGSWPGHCYEPYEINNIGTTGPIVGSGSTTIFCDVFDWQNDINYVAVDTTPITGGYTFLTKTGPNTWTGTVANTTGAPPGDYPCWIVGNSPDPAGAWNNLYQKAVLKIRLNKFRLKGSYALPSGPCSLDIGVIGSASGSPIDSHILTIGDDPAHAASPCDAIEKYTAYYGGSAMYKSLVNLDPANATYQPWPPERIDATNDGAAGWNNLNSQLYVQAGYTPPNGIANMYIYSNIDRNKNFNFAWPNDHRHFLQKFNDFDYFPIDVCDDFKRFQHALMVDFHTDARPMGFEAAPGGNYLNNDIIFYTSMGAAGMTGTGPGKIEPGWDIGGIDVWQTSYWTARMFILERGSDWAVEVFDISNTQPAWGLDAIQWKFQIALPESTKPLDCELLPINADFIHNKNNPTLCVLITYVAGGGGDIYFYDASNGNWIGSLGSLGTGMPSPPIPENPEYLDTDDGHYEIHAVGSTAAGPVVRVYQWI